MNYIIKGETLSDIANAIRTKKGSTEQIKTTDFASEILTIQGGGSGEKPTLFAPYISLNSVTSVLTITDEQNGDFAQGYNLYANDELITVLTSKTAKLTDYIEHTETIDIKVQATSTNFNPSDYAVVEWAVTFVATVGLEYGFSWDKKYAYCKGIGTATDTNIVIASEYEGLVVETIGEKAFDGCKTLTSVIIPYSVKSISINAFLDCSGLTSVIIGEAVTAISNYAFSWCTSLPNIVIPKSVTFLGEGAFSYCENLKQVDFSNHTSIPTVRNASAFSNTHADLQIKVPANLIDEWKSATNWSAIADKIVTEFTNIL